VKQRVTLRTPGLLGTARGIEDCNGLSAAAMFTHAHSFTVESIFRASPRVSLFSVGPRVLAAVGLDHLDLALEPAWLSSSSVRLMQSVS
jgi:hypothetical protein